ncbi:MAG TPA: FeoB small GTPase domain-containing protein [Desulfitobacteriaceae bacterium]|nr:FeoB small GTPase domain-containing protein [Desulfitobacteriaceae bacterium]
MDLTIGERPKHSGRVMREYFGINTTSDQYIIALAGNPNVGKSTVFNALTGLRQHTGNWPGKTVDNAQGTYSYKNKSFLLVDLPGTYSLLAHSIEEEIARDFICFGKPNATVVIVDATSLERNLNLALQIMEITDKVVVCVNLVDEARKKKIKIQFNELEKKLGVPVIPTAARNGEGLEELQKAVSEIVLGKRLTQPKQIAYSQEVEEAIRVLMPQIASLNIAEILNPKWLALRFLDNDSSFLESINRFVKYRKKCNLKVLQGRKKYVDS